MRLPNGMGSAYKMQGARRKPWIARKTMGYTEEGKQIYRIIGYFKTKKDAIEALVKAANLSYNNTDKMLTVQEMFDRALERENFSENTTKSYKHTFKKYLIGIKDLKYDKITLDKMQTITNLAPTAVSKVVFNVFRLIDDYAMEYDYIGKAYSRFIRVKTIEQKHEKKPFTVQEIDEISKKQDPIAKTLMIYLYTGFRKEELLKLKKAKVFLDAEIPYFVGGNKTKAGKDRTIPIHSKILKIVKEFYSNESNYLIDPKIKDYIIRDYLKKHGIKHCIHEARHTFRTELDKLNVNKVLIDRLMGHANESVGEKVYTHKTLEELKEAIEKISYK